MTMRRSEPTLWEAVLSALRGPGGDPPDEPFSEQLHQVVRRHIASEEASIDRYNRLIDATQDPIVRALLTELLRDEEQHHGLFHRMEEQLEYELGEQREGGFTGDRGKMDPAKRREAVAEIREMVDHESQGTKHLRELAKESRESGADFLGLLLDAIAIDSQKHEKILKFVAKRMRSL